MLFVCLTFDYELFMQDNNASYDEILFTPTEKIQAMLNEENAKGTFFADVCSAIVHKQCGLTKFSDAFLRQIQSLTKNGHDVQLHLHPSWYRAERRGDMLIPSHDGYRLHEFGFSNSRESAITIINDGIDYLNESLSLIDENYKCIAYRAGGFALQPERKIFEAMVQKGIVIDSSVVPHMKNYAINGFDFSDVPDCLNWWINSEHGLNKVASTTNKQIFEVPVATLRPRLLK